MLEARARCVVFCPNCGTQNPDAAQACSKCNFQLKSTSAPKFKGTMLMMNPPGALPGTPAPPAAAPATAPAPAPGGARPVGAVAQPAPPGGGYNRLKATMVGVAPPMGPMGGVAPPAPAAPAASPAAPAPSAHGAYGSAVSTPDMPPGGAGRAADVGFFAERGQGAVNPLGGTVASGASPYGVAPGGGTYQGQGLGSPNPYAPSPGYTTAAEPPAVQMKPYGPPAGGLAPHGALQWLDAASAGPQQRNALMTWLLPFVVIFGGVILSTILSLVSMTLGSLAYVLFVLGGATWYLILAIQMATELKAVTQSEDFAWWPALVPFFNLYWAWVLVPQEVAKAKQRMGIQTPMRPMVLYVVVWHFALASDLNDMVRRSRA